MESQECYIFDKTVFYEIKSQTNKYLFIYLFIYFDQIINIFNQLLQIFNLRCFKITRVLSHPRSLQASKRSLDEGERQKKRNSHL